MWSIFSRECPVKEPRLNRVNSMENYSQKLPSSLYLAECSVLADLQRMRDPLPVVSRSPKTLLQPFSREEMMTIQIQVVLMRSALPRLEDLLRLDLSDSGSSSRVGNL